MSVEEWWRRRRWGVVRCLACGVQRRAARADVCETSHWVHLGNGSDPHRWADQQAPRPRIVPPWEVAS